MPNSQTTLVFHAVEDDPALAAECGDYVVCQPGAREAQADVLVVHRLPRGRLGKLMAAVNDGRLILCDPPASAVSPAELLKQLLQPL